MKPWQLTFLIALLATAGWAIVSHPPGANEVRIAVATPVPTPTPEPRRGTVRLLFAGDTMLSRSVGDMMARRNDWTWPFTAIASVTRGADLMFLNLESVLSDRGEPHGCGYCFRADPRAIAGLAFAGVDIVSVANNHAWDYGRAALEHSLALLASGSIDAVGAGQTASASREPVIRSVGRTRIAYLASTDILPVSAQATDKLAGVNLYEPSRMAADIARARTRADVVVVSFHTGVEYEPLRSELQQRIYRAAIDAGADLVVGHHPHVVQDWERYRGGWIFYSLGNFVFDQSWSPQTQRGALLSVTVEDGRIADASLIPVDISGQYRVSVVPETAITAPSGSATMNP
jgi:poly-gamma-glutamate synthesis protein (capsule biosynthesis protein)